jgi:hypothetical protein
MVDRHHRFDFRPKDPALLIEQVIAKHVGADNAISMEGIGQEVWRYHWSCNVAGKHGFPVYPHRENCRRLIRETVRELRRQGKQVGSSRGTKTKPPGYFMIVNHDELVDTVRTKYHQVLDELETIEALTGKDFNSSLLATEFAEFSAGKKIEELEGGHL